MERTEHNFLIGEGVQEADHDLFFGPLTAQDVFQVLPEGTTMPDILLLAGVFDSKTAARKNGWGHKAPAQFTHNDRKWCNVVSTPGLFVPEGFTDFRAGKGKVTRITILKVA